MEVEAFSRTSLRRYPTSKKHSSKPYSSMELRLWKTNPMRSCGDGESGVFGLGGNEDLASA